MGFFSLNNTITGSPDNANEGYNNSWIRVDNDAGRLLYAQANYITNFEDMEIILQTQDVRIGAVEISDADNTSLRASVASTPVGGALRVLSQDLESDVDTVSLGDIYNNKVGINVGLSALNVYAGNIFGYATSALQTTQNNNLLAQISWLKALSSTRVTVLNPITGYSTEELQLEQITLLNSLTGLGSDSTIQLLQGLSEATTSLSQNLSSIKATVLNPTLGYATSALQNTSNNYLNSQIGWLKALSSTRVTVLNPVTGYSTDELQLEQINLLNSLTGLGSDSTIQLLQGLSSIQVTVQNPVTSVSLTNTVSTVNFTNTNITVGYGDNSGNLDAFSRLRVSTPTTLFDSKTLHNKASLFWSQTTSSNASVNFTGENVDASVTLSTSGVGEYAIRQTTQRFNYQPGKSQLILFTGILQPENNAVKRYGVFQSLTSVPHTPDVGLYFETLTSSSSGIAVVQSNRGYLVPSLSATRNEWNIDRLDGTGPSGKTLHLSAANIFLIDYEWLGVGRVRYGTVIDGQICYCHQFNNAGNVQGAYIKTCNLPVRAEIRQVGPGTSSSKMICCSVMSEGGSDFTGVTRAVDSGPTGITIGAGVRRAIVGVRLQYNKLDSVNEILNASALVLASNSGNASAAGFKYEILHNPTLATTGTWSDVDNSSNFQYWNGNSAITSSGTVITSGYSGAGGDIDLSGYRFEKFLRMGCSIDGKRDVLFLVITPLQANDGVFGSLTFIESD
jgi:hypothetical protein